MDDALKNTIKYAKTLKANDDEEDFTVTDKIFEHLMKSEIRTKMATIFRILLQPQKYSFPWLEDLMEKTPVPKLKLDVDFSNVCVEKKILYQKILMDYESKIQEAHKEFLVTQENITKVIGGLLEKNHSLKMLWQVLHDFFVVVPFSKMILGFARGFTLYYFAKFAEPINFPQLLLDQPEEYQNCTFVKAIEQYLEDIKFNQQDMQKEADYVVKNDFILLDLFLPFYHDLMELQVAENEDEAEFEEEDDIVKEICQEINEFVSRDYKCWIMMKPNDEDADEELTDDDGEKEKVKEEEKSNSSGEGQSNSEEEQSTLIGKKQDEMTAEEKPIAGSTMCLPENPLTVIPDKQELELLLQQQKAQEANHTESQKDQTLTCSLDENTHITPLKPSPSEDIEEETPQVPVEVASSVKPSSPKKAVRRQSLDLKEETKKSDKEKDCTTSQPAQPEAEEKAVDVEALDDQANTKDSATGAASNDDGGEEKAEKEKSNSSEEGPSNSEKKRSTLAGQVEIVTTGQGLGYAALPGVAEWVHAALPGLIMSIHADPGPLTTVQEKRKLDELVKQLKAQEGRKEIKDQKSTCSRKKSTQIPTLKPSTSKDIEEETSKSPVEVVPPVKPASSSKKAVRSKSVDFKAKEKKSDKECPTSEPAQPPPDSPKRKPQKVNEEKNPLVAHRVNMFEGRGKE